MLYYSHINEDSRVERDLLRIAGSSTLVAVAGSGERIIALLDQEPFRQVYAVDVNEEALFLLQLKITALKKLEVEDYLKFCGHYPASVAERICWFREIENELDPSCRKYWQSRRQWIEKGIAGIGHFEKFLHRVRPVVHLFLGKKIHRIFSKDQDALKGFPHKRWNLLRYFFSIRWIYRFWGNRDKAFVSRDAAVEHIPSALNEIIYKGNAPSCFMAHLIFKGHLQEMEEADLPPSLQKKVLAGIKHRIASAGISIEYHKTDMLDFIRKTKGLLAVPVFYSLSDILSFENAGYMQEVASVLTGQEHTTVWRTFLRNRVNAADPTGAMQQVSEHSGDESTGMYQVFSFSNRIGNE